MIRNVQRIVFFIFAVLFFSTANAEIYTSMGSLKDGEYYPVFGDVVSGIDTRIFRGSRSADPHRRPNSRGNHADRWTDEHRGP